MKIKLTSVFVDDQAKAAKFYTEVLGFVKKNDILKGLGIGLAVESALFLSLDFFAERRAHQYRDKLESVPIAFSMDPSRPQGFHLSFNRSF